VTTPEAEAEILRLHYAEHWRVGTIAAQLGIHPDVVRRVLGLGEARAEAEPRPRLVDPYRAFIAETLARYPRLRATRLHDMLSQRGYAGAVRTLREYVAEVRPKPRREVYLRTEPLPGEQAQVDWAYVGKVAVPGGERALWVFVIVLSHSRALWGEFVFDLTVHSLTRSLVRAARAFGGVPRQWLFDNPKIVVLERRGDAVRFHPVLLDLCGRMRVEPRLCAVARPEHKGYASYCTSSVGSDASCRPRLRRAPQGLRLVFELDRPLLARRLEEVLALVVVGMGSQQARAAPQLDRVRGDVEALRDLRLFQHAGGAKAIVAASQLVLEANPMDGPRLESLPRA
jgi:transposase